MPPRSEALTAATGEVMPGLTFSAVVRRRYRNRATGKPRSQQQPKQQQQQTGGRRLAATTTAAAASATATGVAG